MIPAVLREHQASLARLILDCECIAEQGERAVVELQVDRLVAAEVVSRQPVAVLAARRPQVDTQAWHPFVWYHMPI